MQILDLSCNCSYICKHRILLNICIALVMNVDQYVMKDNQYVLSYSPFLITRLLSWFWPNTSPSTHPKDQTVQQSWER